MLFIAVWVAVFQIIVPMIYRTPLFPILRKAPREAEQKYAEAVEARGVADTLRQADEILNSTNPGVVDEKPATPGKASIKKRRA